jgi:hypothetical protein
MVDRMRAMRRPGESYRDGILRLVELEAGRSAREVAAKNDDRSDRRGVANGARLEAPRCAREEPL